MELNLKNAIKLFFPDPSFDSVFFEAINNSIDAKATKIEIELHLSAFTEAKTLELKISDNGEGFIDKNFERFKKLLEADEEDHKGLGRLVFLHYFDTVQVDSVYDESGKNLKRNFKFDRMFIGESSQKYSTEPKGTTLKFSGFRIPKLYSYDWVRAKSIRDQVLTYFYPLLYRLKQKSIPLEISISVATNKPNTAQKFFTDQQKINVAELPDLTTVDVVDDRSPFADLKMLYSITKKENLYEKSTVVTAIAVDEKTVKVEIVAKGGVPDGYQLIFILASSSFTGKVDSSRQNLTFEDSTLRVLKKIFEKKVADLFLKEIPIIQNKNNEAITSLENKYPHLKGLFEEKAAGFIDQNVAIDEAQNRFFLEQKKILDADYLTEDQYSKSLELSARLLTEYVLYRNLIINKLGKLNPNNKEVELHNIIVPTKETLLKTNFLDSLYTNNAWVLDDRYMSYSSIHSEREIGELITAITGEKVKDSSLRPDIAVVFSDKPQKDKPVDVVIIELKKLGLNDMGEKNNIFVQLLQRATKLLEYYPNKIQRIWFYGIIDIDDEFRRLLLSQDFIQLYSNGTVLYKPAMIVLKDDSKVPAGFFIQSYEALIEDAKNRNHTFLEILKAGFKSSMDTEVDDNNEKL